MGAANKFQEEVAEETERDSEKQGKEEIVWERLHSVERVLIRGQGIGKGGRGASLACLSVIVGGDGIGKSQQCKGGGAGRKYGGLVREERVEWTRKGGYARPLLKILRRARTELGQQRRMKSGCGAAPTCIQPWGAWWDGPGFRRTSGAVGMRAYSAGAHAAGTALLMVCPLHSGTRPGGSTLQAMPASSLLCALASAAGQRSTGGCASTASWACCCRAGPSDRSTQPTAPTCGEGGWGSEAGRQLRARTRGRLVGAAPHHPCQA